jgi:hypothetical protein
MSKYIWNFVTLVSVIVMPICIKVTYAQTQTLDVIVVYGQRIPPADTWQNPGQPTYSNGSRVWNVNDPADPAGRLVEVNKKGKTKLSTMCGQKGSDGSSLDPLASTTSLDSTENRQYAVEALFSLLFGQSASRRRVSGTVFTITFSDGGTERYTFNAYSSIVASPAPDAFGGPQYTPGNGVRKGCEATA